MGPKITLLFTLMIAGFEFVGCNSGNMSNVAGPDDSSEKVATLTALEKPGRGNGGQGSWQYPQYVDSRFRYINRNRGYEAGNLNVPGGSRFHVIEGSLTPPQHIPVGEWSSMSITPPAMPFPPTKAAEMNL